MVNPKLIDTFSDRLDVAWIAQREAPNSDVYASLREAVTQGCEPRCVLGGLADFDHHESVSHRIQPGSAAMPSALPN